ncbi:MAG: transcription-repair coupling factor, partial [Arenimonas sp.]
MNPALTLPAPPLPRPGQQRAYWRTPASASAFALGVVEVARAHRGLVLAVVRDSHGAQSLEHDLRLLGGELPILHFPDWETLPYDLFSPHPDIVSQRVAALYRLPGINRGVLVVPVSSLMQRLPPPSWIAGNALDLRKGQRLDMDAERRRLEASGYRNVPQVLDPGDFAVRGALLDLFPMGSEVPYRIELFDDVIDTLRSFDPETQRSDHTVDSVRLLPAREFPLDLASTRRVREILSDRFDFDPRRCPLYQDLREGGTPAGIEYYLPLFFERTATLFEHLGAGTLVVVGDGVTAAASAFWAQTRDRWEQRRHDVERPVLAPEEIFLPPDALRAELNRAERIEVCGPEHPHYADALAMAEQAVPVLPWIRKGEESGAALKSFLANYPGDVLIAADSAGRREALIELLDSAGLRARVVSWQSFLSDVAQREHAAQETRADLVPLASDEVSIAVLGFEEGFALTTPAIAVLTERQLFPERADQSRRRKRA